MGHPERDQPDEPEAVGLLALLTLQQARQPGRTGPSGVLVPLAEQDRTRWDRAMITGGLELLHRTRNGSGRTNSRR